MPNTLALPAELTIYTVGELRPQWLAWLADPAHAEPDTCVVDAAAVGEMDAAGAQLVASLAQALARQNRPFELRNPSPALASATAALGLNALLGAQEPAGAAA